VIAAAEPVINLILNWFEELKERVPTGGDRHLPHASRLA